MIPKLEIFEKPINQPGLFEQQDSSYIYVKCPECLKNVTKVWDFYIEQYKQDNKNLLVYYNNFCCKICGHYIEELEHFYDQEEQEIDSRNQILELEYLANIRKVEPKSNNFAKIKKAKRYWNDDKEICYVTNCGQIYELISHTLARVTELHKKCRVCKIINGQSKAAKLYDHEVIKLFELTEKLDHTVESNNYKYIDNMLYHYGDLEFIKRKKDKLIINNSQEVHRSGGGLFGPHISCHRFTWEDISKRIVRLPLTAIRDQVYRDVDFEAYSMSEIAEQIEIIENKDTWDKGIVFKANNKYCWFKRDESQECLIILPCKVTSSKEANDSLKPELIKNTAYGYTRIGDYFFIETKEDFKQYDKLQFEKGFYQITEHYGNMAAIAEVKQLIKEKFPERLEKNDSDINWISLMEDIINRSNWFIDQQQYRDKGIKEIIDLIIQKVKPISQKGALRRYPIYDSNHIADNSANIDNIQFVKGFIHHKSREHRRVKFESWNLVLKNEAIESFNVSAQSAYRD